MSGCDDRCGCSGSWGVRVDGDRRWTGKGCRVGRHRRRRRFCPMRRARFPRLSWFVAALVAAIAVAWCQGAVWEKVTGRCGARCGNRCGCSDNLCAWVGRGPCRVQIVRHADVCSCRRLRYRRRVCQISQVISIDMMSPFCGAGGEVTWRTGSARDRPMGSGSGAP